MRSGLFWAVGWIDMRLPEGTAERERGERVVPAPRMQDIDLALHDLCQPLTTLQCRLEMAELLGSPEAYREGVEQGLAECQRMMQVVRKMRKAVQRGLGEPQNDESEAER